VWRRLGDHHAAGGHDDIDDRAGDDLHDRGDDHHDVDHRSTSDYHRSTSDDHRSTSDDHHRSTHHHHAPDHDPVDRGPARNDHAAADRQPVVAAGGER
jgi:hypothetical protein